MGFFSFFKKETSSFNETARCKNTFKCDFIDGPESFKSATVKLGIDNFSGFFMINDNFYKADFSHVKDIGMSRDYLYDRISAGDWLFYVRRGDGSKLMHSLNDERSSFVSQSINAVPHKDFENDYLAPEMAVLEIPITFNVQGTSYNYQADTRKKISQMYLGSTLYLKYWPDGPDDNHKVCVFDDYACQIGYLPLCEGSPLDIELRKQLEFGVPFAAKVLEKGIVQDTDIWWCKAEFTLKAPYPTDSEMVFVNGLGGSYHCRCGCCRADWEVPIYWANQYGMTPCKRCHKTATKNG